MLESQARTYTEEDISRIIEQFRTDMNLAWFSEQLGYIHTYATPFFILNKDRQVVHQGLSEPWASKEADIIRQRDIYIQGAYGEYMEVIRLH